MEDTAGAPPTCRAISLGLLASCTLRSPTPSGHRTLPCEAAVPRPQTEHLVSSSPQNPTKFTVGPQRPLYTPLPAAPAASVPRSPGTPSDELPSRLGRPFTFSSPCQLSLSLWPFEMPSTRAPQPVGLQPLPSLWPWPTP